MNCKRSKYKITLALLILVISHCASCAQTVGSRPQTVNDVFLPEVQWLDVQVWIDNLRIPWSLIFLPDGRALISERPGSIKLVRDNRLTEKVYANIEDAHIGEGGLMGLALHPSFPKEPYIYAIHTYKEGDALYNRVIRLKDFGNEGQTREGQSSARRSQDGSPAPGRSRHRAQVGKGQIGKSAAAAAER